MSESETGRQRVDQEPVSGDARTTKTETEKMTTNQEETHRSLTFFLLSLVSCVQ